MKAIRVFLLVLLVSWSGKIFSQTYNMSATDGTALYATTCSGTFRDDGGTGNYSNSLAAVSYTFFPATPSQYMRLTFTAFNTQATSDYLAIYDGPGGPLIGIYSGASGAFTITASASNATHGLTCRFHSNGNTVSSGWTATVSCNATPGPAPAFTVSLQDCEQGGGTTICSNANLTANSSGAGNVSDLSNPWDGCLSGGENQSSWYYFSPSSSGTVGFTIAPANGTDDYDFALWGPFTTVSCPYNLGVDPLRCSYSGAGGNTGCGNGASDVSEGAAGNGWVSTFNVTAGQVYVMVIDNYSASSNPFTLTWSLTNGSSLNCTVLPVEFLSFTATKENEHADLQWKTASELNNDYFTVERSVDGRPFEALGKVDGAGTSSQLHSYSFTDEQLKEGINYYRIRQTDFNGQSTFSEIASVSFHTSKMYVENVRPVPTKGDVNFDLVTPVSGEIHYLVTDISGRVVSDQSTFVSAGKNALHTSLDEVGPGIYFLHIIGENTGTDLVSRIVKY